MGMTFDQLLASANAPWTSTIAGFAVAEDDVAARASEDARASKVASRCMRVSFNARGCCRRSPLQPSALCWGDTSRAQLLRLRRAPGVSMRRDLDAFDPVWLVVLFVKPIVSTYFAPLRGTNVLRSVR